MRLPGLDQLALPSGARVGLAASAGRDSTALVHAAAAQLSERCELIVIHVAHDLRGEDSEADRRFVAALAETLGLPCRILPRRLARDAAGSLEARARDARYDAFRIVAAEERLSHLLLAHHADDQVESVLLRVLRGSGPRGLAGMPRERRLAPGLPTRLVRPLLDETRDSLAAYAAHHGLGWREDASNEDLTHRRNQVRHDLLPRLRARHPAIDDELLRLAARARAITRDLDALARERLSEVLAWCGGGLLLLDAEALGRQPSDLRAALLHHLWREPDGGPGLADLDQIWSLLQAEPEPATRTLQRRRQATRCGRWLVLEEAEAPRETASVPASDGMPLGGGGRLGVVGLAGSAAIAAALAEAREDPRIGVVAIEDSAALSVRGSRPGDRMQPLGAPGHKGLADLLGRKGPPRPLRSRLPVIVDAAGIVWLPGVPPAERVRIRPETRVAVRLEWCDAPPREVFTASSPSATPKS